MSITVYYTNKLKRCNNTILIQVLLKHDLIEITTV